MNDKPTKPLEIREQEQWTQCDNCFKWRKVPFDILLPPKWTCDENIYDRTRRSCSAPDELSSGELENLLKMNKDFMKTRDATNVKTALEHEIPNPENPSIAHPGEGVTSSAAATTKHPRHRPGCSCIVCIQPPSGKGKHQPTCACNVCSTVKRRFKTLMMRRKKRQSEREAEIARGIHIDADQNGKRLESEKTLSRCPSEGLSQETLKGGLDLNFRPVGENAWVSMISLVQEASLPLETYLRQHGLASLVSDQQAPVENVTMAQSQEGHGADVLENEEGSNEEFSDKGSKGE